MNAPVNAPVDITAQRAERRRQSTFTSMASALHSAKLEAARISVLGNDEAAIALARFRNALKMIDNQAGSLQAEFIELVEIDHEQESAAAHSQ